MFIIYEHVLAARKILREKELAIQHYVEEGLLKVDDAKTFDPVFEDVNRLLMDYCPPPILLKVKQRGKKRTAMEVASFVVKSPLHNIRAAIIETLQMKKMYQNEVTDEILEEVEKTEDDRGTGCD